MRRRDILRAGTGIAVTGIAGCASQPDSPDFTEGFENGLGDWETDAAIGPEVDIEDFNWEAGVSEEEAASGDRSLRVWNQGDYDDGVTWATHPIPIEPGQAYRIEATGQFWSDSESFNTIRHAMMRLGPDRATVEEEFPQLGVNSSEFGETPIGGLREPLWLADGWREYTFVWTTPELPTETLHFAVGTAVIWEADATHYIDDLSVTIEPR
jgi:hypothetical protein